MSYSLNIKGKENPKDKQLVKLEMVFFQSGYARVSKVLDVTGAMKDWDPKALKRLQRTSYFLT